MLVVTNGRISTTKFRQEKGEGKCNMYGFQINQGLKNAVLYLFYINTNHMELETSNLTSYISCNF